LASRALRPAGRREFGPLFKDLRTSWRTITAYWITTSFIVFVLAAGGVSDILRPSYVVEGMTHLGYPVYFCMILGIWKVLGAFAITIPRYPRLKEWAYAGILFDFTGAAASHAWAGDSAGKVLMLLLFTGIALTSWALRPLSRRDLL
jgi:DoxX-like family